MFWQVISGIYMGWSLGANDSANIFGTGVAARLVKYSTAIILISIFVLLGAYLEGPKTMAVPGKMANMTADSLRIGGFMLGAFVASLSAALVMTVMSFFGIPSSTSQAIVGAAIGCALAVNLTPDTSLLIKAVICWIATPIGGIIISMILYTVVHYLMEKLIKSETMQHIVIRYGFILAGCYGAYALGSNNVANTTGVFWGAGIFGPLTDPKSATIASVVGALAIALGVLTYSRNVMETIGKKIVPLDMYSAFIAELSEGTTVHLFTQIGVPVSTSQAIVGAVIGIGLLKSTRTISKKMIAEIVLGWFMTPLSAGILSFCAIKTVYIFIF